MSNNNLSNIETYIVDSFTSERFKGNPAGVCLLEKGQVLSEEQMLLIAKELNLSETAFVKRIDKPNSDNTFSIRYFSTKMEIPLCGHATLAASKVLFEKWDSMKEAGNSKEGIHFITIEDIDLNIQKSGEEIIMEFPIYDTVPSIVPQALLDALGIKEIVNCEYNKETNILILQIEDTDLLANLQPDFEALRKSHNEINGVLVTAAPPKENDFDFYSRYFWPWSGTNEDPVTGGTHTFLTKYWGQRLNKKKMKSFQFSERTGFMEVEWITDKTFLIKSQAVIVLEGQLRV